MLQPAFIDGLKFAREGALVRGRLGLESLGRLVQQGCQTEGLDYSLSGGLGEDRKPFLAVKVTGEIALVCQRCLGKVLYPLNIESRVELTKDWNEVVNPEDDVERVLAEPEMDIAALVEDEVILALPMVPRHDHCGEAKINVTAARPSPFDLLAVLKDGHQGKLN